MPSQVVHDNVVTDAEAQILHILIPVAAIQVLIVPAVTDNDNCAVCACVLLITSNTPTSNVATTDTIKKFFFIVSYKKSKKYSKENRTDSYSKYS